jgi:hypothetical protein
LDAVVEARCPECGRGFDPEKPSSYSVRPSARRRRWTRRGLILVGVLVVVWALIPREVARVTLAWPAPGGGVTSKAVWVAVGPSWLPIRYPNIPAGSYTSPNETTLAFHKAEFWTLQGFRYEGVGGNTRSVPLDSGRVGCVYIYLDPSDNRPSTVVPISPESVGEVVSLLMDQDRSWMSRRPEPVDRAKPPRRRVVITTMKP